MELNCVNVWKTNKKAAVWAVLALVLTAALLTGCGAPQAGPSYHCTVSISCASILEHMELCSEEKRELVPEDGWLLESVEVSFQEGQSAFDVLQQVCRENKLHLEFSTTPVYGSAYIEGIGNLYEFDCGAESGWMAGGTYFRYYPTVKAAAWTPMTVIFMLVYLALVLTPVILDRREDRLWNSLQSNI